MEMKKSHDLPSGSWGTREAGGVGQSESEGLRTRSSEVQKWEEVNVPAQAESKLTPPPPFGPFHALKGVDDAQLR